jgi:hypothetical protein
MVICLLQGKQNEKNKSFRKGGNSNTGKIDLFRGSPNHEVLVIFDLESLFLVISRWGMDRKVLNTFILILQL